MDRDFISRRITELRIDYNISEYQLSLEIGKSKSYIQSITSKRATPSMEALNDICNYFNITIEEFFDENVHNLQDIHRISKKLSELNSEQLYAIETMIDCLIRS